MFYSWSDANKITSRELQIQYTSSYSGMYWGSSCYEFHRIATKEYRYVGMTEAAAKACQDAKLAQYTRLFTQWYDENGNSSRVKEFKCVANVTMDSDEDGLWTVNISVNEDQIQYCRFTAGAADIPLWLFDLSLDYDEEPATGGYLRISQVWKENARLYVRFEQNIQGFDRNDPLFRVENLAEGASQWTQITPTAWRESNLMYFNLGAWSVGEVRLRWGDVVVSNTAETPTISYDNDIYLFTPYWQVVGAEGAWCAQYSQSFPDFNKNRVTVSAAPAVSADAWEDITVSCVVSNSRITTPYADEEDRFYLKVAYEGVQSNTATNVPDSPIDHISVDEELGVAAGGNVVTRAEVSFETDLSEFDGSKVSVRFTAEDSTQTFSGASLSVVQGASGWTASFDPNFSLTQLLTTLKAVLIYDGMDIAEAQTDVEADPAYWIMVNPDLNASVDEYDQVTTVTMMLAPYTPSGEGYSWFDSSKLSISYTDDHDARTFSGNQLSVLDDGQGNVSVTIDVGNVVPSGGMQISETLTYGGTECGTATTMVYPQA